VLLSSAGLIVSAPIVAHADPDCTKNGGVYAVFARGSGEHLNDQRAHQFYRSVKGAVERVGLSFDWSEVGNEDGDVPVNMNDDPNGYGWFSKPNPDDSGEYPATGAGAGFSWVYSSSMVKGTNELVAHLNNRVAKCPQETFVLGGYSQGADVVGWALQRSDLSWTARYHIGYVALYGDPKFDPGPINDRMGNQNFDSTWWWVRGQGDGYHWTSTGNGIERYKQDTGYYGVRVPYTQSDFKGRFGSWCAIGDGICTGMYWEGVGFGTHGSAYQGDNGWIARSTPEIVYKAVQKRNELNPSLLPATSAGYTIDMPDPVANPPIHTTPPPPVVNKVKRTAGPDGVREVYAATRSSVTEGWWYPGGDGVHIHEMINIAQDNITGFDKVNEPDGVTQSLYTAVPDGVWETWWRPNEGTHSAKIVAGLNGVRQVIADPDVESGQYTHRLYLLVLDGPYEVWWREGGDGIHMSRLDIVSDAVTMEKSKGPDGTDQLYVATPTWVYELWWRPGQGVHNGTIINITQGDIRSLSKGDNLSDGGQLLYTGTSTTAWQSYWLNSAPSHGTIATGQTNAIQVKKTTYNGVHELYLATGDHVQEYWWNGGSSGGGELIRISQNNITSFDKSNDGAAQQVYTASGDLVYETWWAAGISPSSSVLFKVDR
jgi:hypothetical protein